MRFSTPINQLQELYVKCSYNSHYSWQTYTAMSYLSSLVCPSVEHPPTSELPGNYIVCSSCLLRDLLLTAIKLVNIFPCGAGSLDTAKLTGIRQPIVRPWTPFDYYHLANAGWHISLRSKAAVVCNFVSESDSVYAHSLMTLATRQI